MEGQRNNNDSYLLNPSSVAGSKHFACLARWSSWQSAEGTVTPSLETNKLKHAEAERTASRQEVAGPYSPVRSDAAVRAPKHGAPSPRENLTHKRVF